jgi:general secretion pathway protein G
MRAQRGFTLVEILIVVVILGILAAIVVPQFTQASTEASENSLRSDLQSLRSQIELYRAQHTDQIPQPTFTGPIETWPQMTETTTRAGAPSGSKIRTPVNECGPYLERVPNNPFTRTNTIVSCVDRAANPRDGTTAWAYVPATGEIYANHGGQTAQGELYSDF